LIKQIKNIIFDLGGVILGIDYQKTIDSFIALGAENFQEHYTQMKQDSFFDDFEKGKISPQEFLNKLRNSVGYNISDQQLVDAWNAMLLDLPKENLDFLKVISEQYNTYLLSNTNAIHYDEFWKRIEEKFKLKDFSSIFIKEYYSHAIGHRKPEKACFQFVLDDAGLDPNETLFIDDSEQHLKGASSLGIESVQKKRLLDWSMLDPYIS